jgi:hypothetical protein
LELEIEIKMPDSNQAQWLMPIIPATWEVGVGGAWSQADSGQSIRSYVKKGRRRRRRLTDPM